LIHKFIIKILAFLLPVLLAIFVLSNRGEIIPFTGSISFDAKLFELRNRGNSSIDNIAIGSSMTLNNLSSDIMATFLSGESYYNISSWGQNIGEDYSLLKKMVPIYSPKRVFIVSYCGDFGNSSIDCYQDIDRYLCGGNFFSKILMAKYKLKRQFLDFGPEYETAKLDTCSYSCLRFDKWGGIPLNVYGVNISEKRWNQRSHFCFDAERNTYDSLKCLCEYLRSEGVELVFVFSPARQNYYAGNYGDVQKHINYIQSIVQGYNHTFLCELDYSEYPDSLFCDYCHLNDRGSRLFTSNIVKHLDSLAIR